MSVKQLFDFRETKFVQLEHRVKVFIFGQDCSTHLKGALTITYGGRDSHNTASFELSNPRRVWQITEDNLGIGSSSGAKANGTAINVPGKWLLGGGEYSERIKACVFQMKNDTGFNAKYELDTTVTRYANRDAQKTKDPRKLQDVTSGNINYNDPGTNAERKYRLAVNDCIFHRHDPVRIFILNPYMPRTGSKKDEQWLEVFCGFVNQHPITTNYITGESTVRFDCYDIKQIMAKMRIQTNPTTAVLDPQPIFTSGFFKDALYKAGETYTHRLTSASLEDCVKDLILGPNRGMPHFQEELEEPNPGGVGGFRIGNVVCYDPEHPADTLAMWHLMSIFGVNKKAFPEGSEDNLWLTHDEMVKIGSCTCPIKGGQVVGGPTDRYIHMLLPYTGTGPTSLVNYTIDLHQGDREWVSRWEMLRDLVAKLDFQLLTSPSGDLLLEFPQYGFTPCSYKINNATSDCKHPNGLQNLLTFNIHQKDDTLNDEAEDFPTVLTVTGGMGFTPLNEALPEGVHPPSAYIYSPVLVDRYGVIAESTDIPWAGQKSDSVSADVKTSGLLRRLGMLGLLEYVKRLADASTWSGSVVYRPFLLPNRPVELKRSARVGLLTSVSHTWNIGKDASTALSLHQLMAKRSDGSYRLITGAVNTPIDYASMWNASDPTGPLGATNHGIRDSVTDDRITTGTAAATGTPDAPASATTAPFDVTNPPPAADNSQMLWPPFATKISAMIDKANKSGMNISIGEGWRSVARSEAIKKAYLAKGKGDFAAKPYGSYHNYGLAVDLRDNSRSDGHITPQVAANLQDILNGLPAVATPDLNIAYGTFNPIETWHFDCRASLPPGTYMSLQSTLKNELANGTDERTAVIRCQAILNAAFGASPPPVNMTSPPAPAGETPSKPCEENYLEQSDLALRNLP